MADRLSQSDAVITFQAQGVALSAKIPLVLQNMVEAERWQKQDEVERQSLFSVGKTVIFYDRHNATLSRASGD